MEPVGTPERKPRFVSRREPAATLPAREGWSPMRRLWQGLRALQAAQAAEGSGMGVVVAFEDKEAGQGAREAGIERLVGLVRADMERVNAMILARGTLSRRERAG